MADIKEWLAIILAAVATAWAMNISPELISAGMDTFVPELQAAA